MRRRRSSADDPLYPPAVAPASVEALSDFDLPERALMTGQILDSGPVRAAPGIVRKGEPGDCLMASFGRGRIYASTPEGSEILLNVMGPGELWGEIALLDGSTRTASAAALEHVDLLRIHRNHFLPYVRANPDLLLGMLSLVCRRLRWTSSIIEDSAFLSLPARLAKRLLVLAEHYSSPDGRSVTIPLSQHELGNMVKAGREAINQQLSLWRAAGIVDTARGVIVIRNCEALSALIGCS